MLKIDQYEFKYVCNITPETDNNGNIIEYSPQELYTKKQNVELHEYGKGPFCKFKIPNCWAGKEGVYCIYSDDQLVYVGECVDLSKRFNIGYGNIAPRNCFKGGQSTNCKVNNFILNEIKQGRTIKLYFLETKERYKVEKELIEKFHPPWNSQSGKNVISNVSVLILVNSDQRSYNIRPSIPEISGHRSCGIRPPLSYDSANSRHLMFEV